MPRKLQFLVVLCLCAVSTLLAQTDRGVITGTVKDASGAVVPGAQVTAIQTSTNASYTTKTTTSGDFTVPSLPVGNYRVRVENTGFKTYLANDVAVAAGADGASWMWPWKWARPSRPLRSAANAQMLQTEAARVATEVSNRLVDELPVVVNGAVAQPLRPVRPSTPEVSSSAASTGSAAATAAPMA